MLLILPDFLSCYLRMVTCTVKPAAISTPSAPPCLTSVCYSVGRFNTSPGENTWNAIKLVVGLVCASCKPPLVNTTVGCTQVHWLDGEEGRGRYSAKNAHPNKPFSHTLGLEIRFFFNQVRNWANNSSCCHWKCNFVRIFGQKLILFGLCVK